METRASSASVLHSFTSSRRRSSVGFGKGRRTVWPSLVGVIPRSELAMAFSMADSADLSHGSTTSMLASGTFTPASWVMGVGWP